jgi:hypothetical protein
MFWQCIASDRLKLPHALQHHDILVVLREGLELQTLDLHYFDHIIKEQYRFGCKSPNFSYQLQGTAFHF